MCRDARIRWTPGLAQAAAKIEALHVSPPDRRSETRFGRGETHRPLSSSRWGLMKMTVISEELYAIGISLFDRPDQSVPGDHRSGLDIRPWHRAAYVAEVVRQRRRDRGPAVFVEPLLGRVVLLVVDQLEEQPVLALGPSYALSRDGSLVRFGRQRRAFFHCDMTSRTGQRVDPGEQLLSRGDGQIDQ